MANVVSPTQARKIWDKYRKSPEMSDLMRKKARVPKHILMMGTAIMANDVPPPSGRTLRVKQTYNDPKRPSAHYRLIGRFGRRTGILLQTYDEARRFYLPPLDVRDFTTCGEIIQVLDAHATLVAQP